MDKRIRFSLPLLVMSDAEPQFKRKCIDIINAGTDLEGANYCFQSRENEWLSNYNVETLQSEYKLISLLYVLYATYYKPERTTD